MLYILHQLIPQAYAWGYLLRSFRDQERKKLMRKTIGAGIRGNLWVKTINHPRFPASPR